MIGKVLVCFAVLSLWNAGVSFGANWDYKNLDQWPKLCSSGAYQSPIALSTDDAQAVSFPPFQFHDYDAVYDAHIKNNGHTVEVRLNVAKKPAVSGGGLQGFFALDALHFHWESEHTVDDRRFPLELHLVHYDNRTRDVAEALNRKAVAVLSVLFYHSADDDTEFSPLFDAIQYIGKQSNPLNVPVPIQRLELDDFLPRDRAGFYRYMGSLTTPGCTEGVTWTVFTNGLPISAKQLRFFSQLLAENHQPITSNYRPLQEVNGRPIYLKMSSMSGAQDITVCRSLKMFMLIGILMCLF